MKRTLILSFSFLLFVSTDIFARAGGGGGGAGSGPGRGIMNLIPLIMLLILLWFISHRAKQSKKQILESAETDPIWNYNQLCEYVENVFMWMQDAWTKKDFSSVQDLITDNCKFQLEKDIHHYVFCNETNYMDDIEIKRIEIVGCEDYIDNEKDSFTAYIYGSMVDYTISGLTKSVVEGDKKKSERFRDLYYFKRHNDNWLLDKIDNTVTISKVYHCSHYNENDPSEDEC